MANNLFFKFWRRIPGHKALAFVLLVGLFNPLSFIPAVQAAVLSAQPTRHY